MTENYIANARDAIARKRVRTEKERERHRNNYAVNSTECQVKYIRETVDKGELNISILFL